MNMQFIFTNLLMLSVGTILYLMVRALPRLDEDESEAKARSFFERWFASGLPERIDEALKSFSVKFLRKTKVHILKIENYVTRKLHAMTQENTSPFGTKPENDPTKQIDFKEILEERDNG